MNIDQGDFDPILGEGQLEKSSGLRARRRRQDSLPVASYGSVVMVVDSSGRIMSGESFTAGERFWGPAGTWLTIDTADHELHFPFSFASADGQAGYVIEVLVVARVTDPQAVAHRRVGKVGKHITPALRTTISAALSSDHGHGDDTVPGLNRDRRAIEASVRGRVITGLESSVGGWLTYQALDITVAFDPATQAHLDALVEQARNAQLGVIDLRNEEGSVGAKIAIQTQWTTFLKKQMSDPTSRAVAAAAADPTPENIAKAVAQLDEDDKWTRVEIVSILNKLIDKDFVGDLSELQGLKAVVESLQRGTTPLTSDRGSSRPPAIVGDVVQTDPPSSDHESNSDRDWQDG